MDDRDYFTTALADLSEALDRLAGKNAPKFELAAALSRCETSLMRLADPEHHGWLCEDLQKLADKHELVAHCTKRTSGAGADRLADDPDASRSG